MASEKRNNDESIRLSHTFEELIEYLTAVQDATARAEDHVTLNYVDDIITVVKMVSKVSQEEAGHTDTDRRLALACIVGVRADLKHPN